MELQKLMDEIAGWSDATFGQKQRISGMAAHLAKEVKELIESIYRLEKAPPEKSMGLVMEFREEIADCLMLLLDIASHASISSNTLIAEVWMKLERNKKRKWGEPDIDGAIEHIKEQRDE